MILKPLSITKSCSWVVTPLYKLIKYFISGRLLSLSLNELSSSPTSYRACEYQNTPLNYYHKLKGKVWARGTPSNVHLANVSTDLCGLGNCTASINILPEIVLLDIFDFCRIDELPLQLWIFTWKWDVLVHVCRRWQQLIFSSPHRLHIQLCCTPGTPVRKYLNCWPAFPIIVDYGDDKELTPDDEHNVIAALAHSNCVCTLEVAVTNTQLEKLVTVMQKPYPALKRLVLTSDSNTPDLPARFLGGSAPCLRELKLQAIPFPALPTLLSSATDLVNLHLYYIPKSGHIAPGAMVAGLARLTSLRSLHIRLKSKRHHPYRSGTESLCPVTRAIIPALHCLVFGGEFEYLEDLVAQIETPQLNALAIYFYWNREVNYELPQLSAFINRSENLKQILSRKCLFRVDKAEEVGLRIGGATSGEAERWDPETEPSILIGIACIGIEAQVSHLAHVLSWIFPILPSIVHFTMDSVLFMYERGYLDSLEWLQLLRQFSSIQTLLASANISRLVSNALNFVDEESFPDFLPALGLLCLEGQPLSSIQSFITRRRNCGHPVTFVKTKDKFEKRLISYP
jgi:hypothetical protein